MSRAIVIGRRTAIEISDYLLNEEWELTQESIQAVWSLGEALYQARRNAQTEPQEFTIIVQPED